MTDSTKRPHRRAIVILGMHRSGTSALARVVNLLGAELPGNLMPALPNINESGFWESKDIADLDDRILAFGGSNWRDTLPFPDTWFTSPAASYFRDRALQLLQRDFQESPMFVIKDPRMCKLVPLWISVLEEFDAEALFIIIHRNPLEVAASLKRRDGISQAQAMLLWLGTMLDAERYSRPFKRSFVRYDQLLVDWREAATRISKDLNISWPSRSDHAAVAIDSFLRGSLRHHVASDESFFASNSISPWAQRMFALLNALANGSGDYLSTEFDSIREALELAGVTFGPVIAELLAKGFGDHEGMEEGELTAVSHPHEVPDERLTDERLAGERLDELESKTEVERFGHKNAESSTTSQVLATLKQRIKARDFEIERLQMELDALDEANLAAQANSEAVKRMLWQILDATMGT